VFLAAAADEHLVALKVMLEHLTVRELSRAAFLREGRTASLLKHPNLVEVYNAGEDNGRPWISMELVRGCSLSGLVKKLRAAGDRLDQDEAAELVRQAALGLHFAHEVKGRDGEPLGLVHRDVSPHNIMVSETGIAKVVDFGLVKATALSETITATLKGKLRYMPPEQLKSEKVDRRCDVFALGAVLWELACGTPLYPGASEAEVFQQALYSPQPHPDEVAKGLTRSMVTVLQATIERDQDKRMPNAKDLAEALAPLSSPHARDKLSERVAKYFERLPRTLEEAKGNAPGAPTQAVAQQTGVLLSPGGTPKPKRVGVLAPPATKGPRYAAPASGTDTDFRERRTDQINSPRARPKSEASVTHPTHPAQAAPEAGTTGQAGPANPTNPDLPTPTGQDLPPPPQASEARRGPGQSPLGERVEEPTGSGTSLPPLLEGPTRTTAPSGVTLVTSVDDPPEQSWWLTAPSRRTMILAALASVGLVALGGVVGMLVRRGDDTSEPMVDPRLFETPVTASDEAGDAPQLDGGPTAAKVAQAKKSTRLGRVEIEANVPAVVRERNVDLGVTPFSRSFSPGRHRLSVATPDGQSSTEMDLVVRPGETVHRTVRLSAR
jgi:serine/threonine-protein kinase